jgi:GEVED domain/Secretion system C-terminal sorting domain/SprB repeat
MAKSTAVQNSNSCGFTAADGEFEDYNIRIVRGPSYPLTFTWSLASTLLTSTGKTVTTNPINATTTYTLTGADANGCSGSTTVTVSVDPISAAVITATPSTVCPGSNVTLCASYSNGGGVITFIWKNPSGVTIGNTQCITFPVPASGVYSLTVSDACGNSTTSTINLIATALPIIAPVGGQPKICGTSSSSATITMSGASTYTWTPAVGTPSGPGPFVVTVANNTAYTVVGTDANGCTNSTTFLLLYRPNYLLYPKALPPAVCPNGLSTLIATDTNYGLCNPPLNYCNLPLHKAASICIDSVAIGSWINATGTFCSLPSYTPSNGLPVVSLSKSLPYSLTSNVVGTGFIGVWIDTNQNGVFNTNEFFTDNINNPNHTITLALLNARVGCTGMRVRSRSTAMASGDACVEFVDGETQDYTIRIIETSYTTITGYTWERVIPSAATVPAFPITNSNPAVTTPHTNPPGSWIYRVTATDVNGCTKQSTVAVIVQPLNCGTITVGAGGSTVCLGDSRSLSVNTSAGGQPYSYTWSGPNVVGTGSLVTVTPNTLGTTIYTVSVTDDCGSTCNTTVALTINPKPVLAFNITNQPSCGTLQSVITLGATNTGSTFTFTAIPANTFLSATTGSTAIFPVSFTPGSTTIYTISATGVNGCTSSSIMNIIVSPPFSLAPVATPNALGSCGGIVTITVSDTGVGSQLQPLGYCPAGAALVSDEEILGVTIGSVTNTTSCATPNIGSAAIAVSFVNSFYTDFTNVNVGTYVPGQVVPFSINIGTCGGTFTNSTRIWIDYNRDGDFLDSGESVFATAIGAVGPNVVSGTFTIPNTVTPGITRVRIRNQEVGSSAGMLPCNSASWGEVEDYSINLLATPLYPFISFAWTGPTTITPATGKTVTTVGLTNPSNTYVVTATNSFGCTATGSTIVTVGPVSTPTIVVAPTTSVICAYSCATLTANTNLGAPPYTYLWTTNSASSISGANNTKTITVCPINTGGTTTSATYTVVVTDGCGTTTSKTVLILIQPGPTLTVATTPTNNVICAIGSATFSPSGNGTSYAWNAVGASTVGTQTGNNYIVTPNSTLVNTYIVTATASNSCTRTSSVELNYVPFFSITATANPSTIGCASDVLLVANDTAAGPAILPLAPYCTISTFTGASTGSGLINVSLGTMSNSTPGAVGPPLNGTNTNDYSATVAPPTLLPGATYNITFTTELTAGTYSGAVTTFAIDYNRNSLFEASEFYQVTPTGGAGIPNGTTLSYAFTVPISATLLSPGITKMRVRTRGNGNPNNFGIFCTAYGSGENEDYVVNLLATPVYPITSWVWQPQNSIGKIDTIFGANSSQIYTVVATNAFGCTATATASVLFKVLTCDSITSTANSICGGVNDTLIAIKSGGTAPYSYSWTGANIIFMKDSLIVVNRNTLVPASSNYSVTISDTCGNSCTMVKLINFLPQPTVSVSSSVPVNGAICSPGSGTLTAVTSGTIVNWSGTPGTFTPATGLSTTVTPTAASIYTATAIGANTCTSTAIQIVNFSPPMAVIATATPDNVGSCADTIQLNANVSFGFVAPPGSQYCFPPRRGVGAFKPNYGGTDQITNVTFPPINNTTGQDSVSLYPASVGVPTVTVGVPQTMSISFGSDGAQFYRVWIDFSRDSIFDASESVASGSVGGNGTANITFIPPSSMGTGLCRMRIRGGDDVAIPDNQPCTGASNIWGELEDYYVNLVGIPPPTISTYNWVSSPVTTITPNPSQSPTAVLSGAASFTVNATNSFGCVGTTTVNVTNQPFVFDSIARGIQGAICDGQCMQLTAKVRGGGLPYNVTWTPSTGLSSTSDTAIIACPTSPGTITYTCTIIDACGLSATKSVTIVVNPSPAITAVPQLPSLCIPGTPDTIFTNCAAVCLSSSWQVPAGQPAIPPNTCNPVVAPTIAGPNNYTITCTNFLGCTKTAVATINVASAHTLIANTASNTVCYGDTLSITLIDTTLVPGPQNIVPVCTPSHVPGSACITNVQFLGINNPTVNSCPSPAFNTYTQVATVVAGQSYTLSATMLTGGNIGVWIDLDRSGTFITSERYSFPALFAGGPIFQTTTITIPLNATPGLTTMRLRSRVGTGSTLDPCIQYNSGETEDYRINIIGFGQTTTSNYVWSPIPNFPTGGNIGNPITTLPLTGSTVFTINATDAANCTYSITKSITVTPQILTAPVITNNDCFSYQNGIIDVNASGGVGTLSVSLLPNLGIKGGSAADSFYVLLSDTFQIITTDNAGCIKRDTVEVTEPDELQVYYSTGGALCFGGSSACARVDSIKGGNNPGNISAHSISWLDFSGTQLTPPTYSLSPLNDTICGLSTGTYNLLVIDSKGCFTDPPLISFTVAQPLTPVGMSVVTLTPINCFGDSATIKVTGLGGVGNYKFKINAGPFVAPISGDTFTYKVPAGNYSFEVEDGNNCNVVTLSTVNQPNALIIDSTIVKQVSCNGSNNGTVTIYAQGGTVGALSYVMTSPLTTNSTGLFAGLAPNSYAFTVTDINSCSATTSAVITQPAALAIASLSIVHVQCKDSSNGSIAISFSGGTAPRVISISPTVPGSNGNYSNLAPNTYTITCLDNNSCSLSTIITISEPSKLNINTVVTPSPCQGGVDALVVVSATGGTPNLVAPLYTGTGNFSQASDTTITYTVTDANGCSASTTIVTTAPPGITLTLTVDTAFNCSNGYAVISVSATGGCGTYTGTFTKVQVTAVGQCYTVNSCGCTAVICDTMSKPAPLLVNMSIVTPATACSNATVGFTASGGTLPYSNIANVTVPNGPYTHTITDANGCTASTSLTITAPAPVVIGASSFVPISCASGSSSVIISGSGGVGPYNGIGIFPIVVGANPFSIEDADGCPADTILNVVIVNPVVIGISTYAPIACFGSSSSVTITASGGVGPYTGTGVFPIVAGPNTFIVTDSNGCTDDSILVISEPTAVTASVVVTDAPCGGTNGTIAVTPSGGTPVYTVKVDGTIVNPSVAATYPVGSHTVITSDQNGCADTQIVQILQGLSLGLAATTPAPLACFGDTTTIILSVVGGTAPFTGSTLGTHTIVAGSTSFTVTDSNGCTATITVNLSSPTAVVASAVVTPASCASGNLGAIAPSASGGTGPYSYLIDSVAVVATYAPNTYTVTATDANGCSATISTTVTSIAVAPSIVFSNGSGACGNNPMMVSGTYCQPLVGNQWYHFTTPSGQVYASVNPNGGSLGNVTSTLYNTGVGSLPTNTDLSGFNWNYMNKIWNMVADSSVFSVPASVRFYYTSSELAALKATTPCATCIDQDLVVSQLTGVTEDCDAANNIAGQLNIFWDKNTANTAAELAYIQTGATGNPIVNNYYGNITTGTGASISGNAAFSGVYIEVTVDRFSEFRLHLPSSSPLSVTDLTLVGKQVGNTSVLNWSTATESNNSHFDVLHSTTGLDYKSVGIVKSQADQGNSAAPLSYTFKHMDPTTGHNYYRLRQVDLSGATDQSNVVDVYFGLETEIIMYPNPTSDELHIVQKATSITIKVLDVTGRLVKQVETELVKGANSSTISLGDLTTGLYTISISDGKGLQYSQQIKKQ